MRTLRIGFSRPKKWMIGSQVIQLTERSDFSHSFLRWNSESLARDLVYQASHGMVHFVSGNRFDAENTTVVEYSVLLTDEQFRNISQKCIDLSGLKYGNLQIIGMALERLSGISNPFRDGTKTFVCSELVGEVLKQIIHIDLDLEYIGPKKLENLLSSFGVFTRTI